MKLPKTLLILLVFFIPTPFYFAQEKPQAVLINEAGKTNCETLKLYTDSFTVEYGNEPDARFFIVIHPDKTALGYAVWQQSIINYQTYNYDPARLKIVRAAPQDDYRIAFWKVPVGADTPDFKETGWNTPPPNFLKPFLFGEEDQDEYCPTFIPELYAKLIKKNPNVRGRLVVYEPSRRNAQAFANEWLKTLTEEFKVPRSRLIWIFAKQQKNRPTSIEFWIVPVKKNRRL